MTAEVTEAPAAPSAEPVAPAGAPAAATDELARLRAERDDWKSQARKHEDRDKARKVEVDQRDAILRQLAEKAGIPFDGTPDPAVLTQRLAEQTTLARQRTIELAVYTGAAAAGADASALLDSRAFMDKAAKLDPDGPDFRAQMAELAAEAAKSPKYALARPDAEDDATADPEPAAKPAARKPPAAASGTDFSGAAASARMWTQADLDRATAKGDIESINKAIDAGQLINIGIGPRKHPRR